MGGGANSFAGHFFVGVTLNDLGVRWQAQRNTATWNAPPENITDNGMNKFIIVNPPAG